MSRQVLRLGRTVINMNTRAGLPHSTGNPHQMRGKGISL
jgi:hypothetical protein